MAEGGGRGRHKENAAAAAAAVTNDVCSTRFRWGREEERGGVTVHVCVLQKLAAAFRRVHFFPFFALLSPSSPSVYTRG